MLDVEGVGGLCLGSISHRGVGKWTRQTTRNYYKVYRLQGVGPSGTDPVGPPPAKSDQVILGIMLGSLNIIVLVPRLLGTPTCIDFYGSRG